MNIFEVKDIQNIILKSRYISLVLLKIFLDFRYKWIE
jgi:hypothetical protein